MDIGSFSNDNLRGLKLLKKDFLAAVKPLFWVMPFFRVLHFFSFITPGSLLPTSTVVERFTKRQCGPTSHN